MIVIFYFLVVKIGFDIMFYGGNVIDVVISAVLMFILCEL